MPHLLCIDYYNLMLASLDKYRYPRYIMKCNFHLFHNIIVMVFHLPSYSSTWFFGFQDEYFYTWMAILFSFRWHFVPFGRFIINYYLLLICWKFFFYFDLCVVQSHLYWMCITRIESCWTSKKDCGLIAISIAIPFFFRWDRSSQKLPQNAIHFGNINWII